MNKLTKLKHVLKKAYYEYRCDMAYEEVKKHLKDGDRTKLIRWQKEYLKYSNLCLKLTSERLEMNLR